jgi:hypothetical protein
MEEETITTMIFVNMGVSIVISTLCIIGGLLVASLVI